MNVANLQLEGLLMAIASINEVLVHKGVLSTAEIDAALRKAEASVTGEERSFEELSPANRDAVCFPIRLLRLANADQGQGGMSSFGELTKLVGRTKQPYNDQL